MTARARRKRGAARPRPRRGRGAGPRSVPPRLPALLLAIGLGLGAAPRLGPASLAAQSPEPHQGSSGDRRAAAADDPAVIDTVVILREDLFSREEANENSFLAFLNDLHVTTRPGVIRRELLLERGMPYDSARAEESERNLRARGLFREVEVDSVRLDGRLAAVVRTRDAWSLQPRLDFNLASDGTLTGSVGITESNIGGTGNVVRAWYIREVDRDGMVLAGGMNRIVGSDLSIGGSYQDLSDRTAAGWGFGLPFRSLSDRASVVYGGEVFDGRVLQFRSDRPSATDTTRWTRRALVNRLDAAFAPHATPTGYVRIGAEVEVRREEFFPRFASPSAVPDSVYGLIGTWVEYREAEFVPLRHFNGFVEEDQDLSRLLFLGFKLAPEAFGYASDGVGIRALLRDGRREGDWIVKARVDANALFNAAGLDSGRVTTSATAAWKQGRRHVSFLRLAGSAQERPRPGDEIDLGFRSPPRLWGPHAFIGTRALTATVEHRFFAWDRVADLLGLGIGAFLDYGGAWFPDQDPRMGGNIGAALLLSSSLRASAQVVAISAGWRFGGGLEEAGFVDRLALSVGTGMTF